MTPDPVGWAKLLVVADAPVRSGRLDRLLRDAGYHDIHWAADLDAIPALVATLQPDLLLLDVRRPARGELQLLEILRHQRPARIYLPILVLTARATPARRRRILAAGANDVLTRPVGRREFLLRARNLLEPRRLHRVLQTEKASIDWLQNAALEAAADAIVITDRDGTIRWVNRAFSALTGYAATEVVGQRPRLLRSGQHSPEFYEHLWRTILSGAVWRGEVVNRYKDGRLATEAMTITPVRGDGGAITHFIAIKQDVTEARETARAQARLSAILEASPDFVATADPEGRVLYRNRAARRLLELPDDLAPAAVTIAGSHPPWAAARVLTEGIPAALRDGVWQGETALLSRSGRIIPVAQTILAHTGADGRVEFLSTIARDLRERKHAEEELRRQQGLAAQNEKLAAMSTLLAGVAHELNNPLAVVVGRSALLRAKTQDEALVRETTQLEEAADRCARIVKNFLALARQEPPERAPCCLDLIVRDAVEILAYTLRVDGVELRLELAGDQHEFQADAHQLQQVVINLVSNAHHAVRATPTRRITLRTEYEAARDLARLTVEDTGPGIPPDVERRIFEPFFTTKPLGQGTGLGLPLCRGIVEDHGGQLRVEGRPGLGARFVVELPVPMSPAPLAGPARPDGTRVAPCRILVVDDEPMVATVIADLLAVDRHDVETLTNARAALDRLATRPYDVVFSDVRMPELDGVAFYRALEQGNPAICARLIFLTGDTLDPTLGEFLRQSGRPSIAKPCTLPHLRRALGQVLAHTPSTWAPRRIEDDSGPAE